MTALYQGTTPEAAEAILSDCWRPNAAPSGACKLVLTKPFLDCYTERASP